MTDHNRYDYNHATSGIHHAVTIIVILAVLVILGGLTLGLGLLDIVR